jgi:hypothetical protein
MEAALTILTTMGIGGVVGLIARVFLMRVFLDGAPAASDIFGLLLGNAGLLVALIIALISVVRGDWVPRKSHESALAGKDALITQYEARLTESEQRSDRYETLVLRSLDAATEAAHVASQAVTERGGGA